jgi:hypothetical protein
MSSSVWADQYQSGRAAGGGFWEFFRKGNEPNGTTTWSTLGGKKYNTYGDYAKGIIDERKADPNFYEQAEKLGLLDSNNSGSQFNDLFNRQFENTKSLMKLTNEYRTKEGATQGQMDEQSYRRLSSQLETQKYMQVKGADLQERQRQYDSDRAVKAFKGKF